jgi:hypothetical protein
MRDHFEFAGATEINKRRQQAAEFFRAILDPEEQPHFVSDEATLHDLSSNEEDELINRCIEHYGVVLEPKDFALPVWKLLDHLEKRRKRTSE